MDINSLTITLPTILALGTLFIGLMTYFGNKKKQAKEETNEVANKAKEDEARLVRMETMLINIDKNTNNLNQRVDSHDKLLTKHEARLGVVESKLKINGGK